MHSNNVQVLENTEARIRSEFQVRVKHVKKQVEHRDKTSSYRELNFGLRVVPLRTAVTSRSTTDTTCTRVVRTTARYVVFDGENFNIFLEYYEYHSLVSLHTREI